MRRGRITPMSDTAMLFDVAFGHYGKTKVIAKGVGCTPRQARRMIDRKTIPASLREAVLRLARKNLDTKLVEIEAAINEIHRYEIELAALESPSRPTANDGEALAQADREDERSEKPFVI